MLVKIAIVWYLLGLLMFFSLATFHPSLYNSWAHIYYVWAKTVNVLFLGVIITGTIQPKLFIPLLGIAIIRLSWELISWGTGLAINNPKAIGIIFITTICLCTYIILKEIWQKRN